MVLRGAHPTPRTLNTENIPPESPFVLTVNHYDRPGLGAWWGVAALICTVAERRTHEPREIHFAMAREWWYPRGLAHVINQPFTHWFFGRLEKAYGTILLPPVLGNGEFRGEGALAIRRALELTRRHPSELIGIAPEGKTGANLGLGTPPHGAGLFLLMLTHEKIPCLPVGIFEDDTGTLTVNFGKPYLLTVPRTLPKEERDYEAARQVMVAIGRQLPERMWGAYREDIRASHGG